MSEVMNVGVMNVGQSSNGHWSGWVGRFDTKDSRPPHLCRECTASVFLGLTNTCCNRNAFSKLCISFLADSVSCESTQHCKIGLIVCIHGFAQ